MSKNKEVELNCPSPRAGRGRGWGCVTFVYIFKDNFNLLKKFTTNIQFVLDGCSLRSFAAFHNFTSQTGKNDFASNISGY